MKLWHRAASVPRPTTPSAIPQSRQDGSDSRAVKGIPFMSSAPPAGAGWERDVEMGPLGRACGPDSTLRRLSPGRAAGPGVSSFEQRNKGDWVGMPLEGPAEPRALGAAPYLVPPQSPSLRNRRPLGNASLFIMSS